MLKDPKKIRELERSYDRGRYASMSLKERRARFEALRAMALKVGPTHSADWREEIEGVLAIAKVLNHKTRRGLPTPGVAMSTDDIMGVLTREIEGLRLQYGVKGLILFGAAARDELSPGSDVDIVVEFEGPAMIDRYLDVKEHLEDVLGRDVDLVTKASLKPRLLDRIKNDMLPIG